MRSALISVAWNSDDWTFEALMAHYRTLARYLNLTDMGTVLGYCCHAGEQAQDTAIQALRLYPRMGACLGLLAAIVLI